MPSPESMSGGHENTGENIGRDAYEQRGEKALDAARRAEIQRLLAKRIEEGKAYERKLAELRARAEAKRAEIASLEAGESAASASDSGEATPPVPPVPPETSGVGSSADPESNPSTPETGSSTPESKPSEAEIKNTVRKAKKHNGFKTLIVGLLALAVGTATFFGINSNNFGSSKNRESDLSTPTAVAEPVHIETQESEKGIKDGYGEKGLWLSEHKDHDYDYGDAEEVAEVCENDEVEMLKYTGGNQVESLADYIERMPKGLCPEGYEDLSVREIEAKLESLTPDEYETVKAKAMHALDEAFTRRTVTQRDYHHYGMLLEDPNGAVVHENMQLVDRGIGTGVEVVEFYWEATEDHEAGSMLVNIRPVYNNDGDIIGYTGGLEVLRPGENDPATPISTPEPEPTPTPTPELNPKNEDEEIAHAGDPGILDLDEDVTPPTTLEQDQAGFDAIAEQQQEAEAAAAEAARIAAQEQADREAAAAEAEAAETAGASAGERADLFASGDF